MVKVCGKGACRWLSKDEAQSSPCQHLAPYPLSDDIFNCLARNLSIKMCQATAAFDPRWAAEEASLPFTFIS